MMVNSQYKVYQFDWWFFNEFDHIFTQFIGEIYLPEYWENAKCKGVFLNKKSMFEYFSCPLVEFFRTTEGIHNENVE